MSLELSLLGCPAVFQAGRQVSLPTRKALGLLAYLALEGTAPRSKLADLLWSELDEDTARKNLRQELHRLSQTPLADHLELSPLEIRLVGPVETDVGAFRKLLEVGKWEKALELYRGELLENLELRGASSFEEWLEAERERLALEYQKALAQAAAGREQSGDLRAALGFYQRLLEAEPLQEHTYREAMRLHGLLGEREAALELFRRCREMLKREFALEPLPETAALAERIRAPQTPAPPKRPSPARRTPVLEPPLVGREREWERLEGAFAEGRVVYVAGQAGVGKSRLVREFGLSKGGYNALQGYPSDLNVPYATLTRGMRSLLAEGKVRLEPWERSELSRLIPELSETPPPPLQAEFERLRLFEAYAEVYWRATQDIPLMIGEDLHWFDPASAELARYIETRFAETGRRVHSFATFRPEELSPPVWAMIRDTAGAARAELIELEPLSELGVAELVSRLSGQPATVFPRRIYKATGGNPFFVLETLRGLFESGQLRLGERGVWETDYDDETADYRELPLPPGVRQAVLGRVERLGAVARRLLEVAGLVGEGFRLDDLTGATALGEWEGLEALEAAQKAGLVRETLQGYGFAHDLIRRALEEGLTPERRRLIHRRLAETLEKNGAEPARVAQHLEQAGRTQEAGRWWGRAGEAAQRVFAHREAFAHYARALELLPADAPERFDLLARHEALAYDLGEREAEAASVAEMERLADTPARKGRAALRRYALRSITGRPQEALVAAEGALEWFEKAADSAGRAEALFHLAEAHYYLERFPQALERIEAALEPVRAHNPALLARAYNLKGFLHSNRGDLELALGAYTAALESLQTRPNPVLEARTLNNRATDLCFYGCYSRGLADVDEALRIARRIEMRQFEGFALDTRVKALRGLGRFGEALTDLERAIRLGRGFQSARLVAHCLAWRTELLNDLGQPQAVPEAAEEALRAALEVGSASNRILALSARAGAHLELGRPALALADAGEAYGLLEAQGGLRENLPEGVRLRYVRALLANGRGEEARGVLERARAEMLERGGRIRDPELRENYLNMRVNRELMGLEAE